MNGNDCTVTMNADRGVTATFQQSAPAVPVPAVGPWGLLAAAAGLGIIGMRKARSK